MAVLPQALRVFALLAVAATSTEITPVQKVIDLLVRLQDKVTKEGQAEAKEYDKFACFCKDQASEKLYAQEQAQKRIDRYQETIEKLDSEREDMESDLSDSIKEIKKLLQKSKDAKQKWGKEHGELEAEIADIDAAVGGLIEADKATLHVHDADSTNLMQKSAVLEQVRAAINKAHGVISKSKYGKNINPKDGKMDIIDAAGDADKDANMVHELIESVENDLISMEDDVKKAQQEADFYWESKIASLTRQMRRLQEKIDSELKPGIARRAEEASRLEGQIQEETTVKGQDKETLDKLSEQCERQAEIYDQRSTTRSAEITALTDAMAEVKKGAAKYGANKKLVLLQTRTASVRKMQRLQSQPVALLQVRRTSMAATMRAAAARRAQFLIAKSGEHLKSSELSLLAVKIEARKDHFYEVRGLIKDLIDRLKKEAEAEKDKKGDCDTQIGLTTDTRDTQQAESERLTGELAVAKSDIQKKTKEVAELRAQVADNEKGKAEAQELRKTETANNAQTVLDATSGMKATQNALEILNGFYSFVQTSAKKHEGRNNGKSAQPFEGEYGGSHDSANGIIGMLEVVVDDFDRTIKETRDAEKNAQDEFDTAVSGFNDNIDTKNGQIDKSNDEINTLKEDVNQKTDDLASAQKLLSEALSKLETLKEMCIEQTQSYEQEVQQRTQEIASLKEALKILTDIAKP